MRAAPTIFRCRPVRTKTHWFAVGQETSSQRPFGENVSWLNVPVPRKRVRPLTIENTLLPSPSARIATTACAPRHERRVDVEGRVRGIVCGDDAAAEVVDAGRVRREDEQQPPVAGPCELPGRLCCGCPQPTPALDVEDRAERPVE